MTQINSKHDPVFYDNKNQKGQILYLGIFNMGPVTMTIEYQVLAPGHRIPGPSPVSTSHRIPGNTYGNL